MNIIYAEDYADLSRKAANQIAAQVILKPESVLGLATGSSPLGTYWRLSSSMMQGMWILPRAALSTWMNTAVFPSRTIKVMPILCGKTSSAISTSGQKTPIFPMA